MEAGDFTVLDAVGRRDRYQQFAETARALLSDFREVEANFRRLDRDLRERITTWDGARANCWTRWWEDAATSPTPIRAAASRRSTICCCPRPDNAELTELLQRVHRSTTGRGTLTADCATSTTIGSTPVSGRRQRCGNSPSSCADSSTTRCGWRTAASWTCCAASSRARFRCAIRVGADFVVTRSTPPRRRSGCRWSVRSTPAPRAAPSTAADVEQGRFEDSSTALYEQAYVDPAPLVRTVRKALQRQLRSALPDVVAGTPITQGLSELVTYLSLDDECFATVFDESTRDSVDWTTRAGRPRRPRCRGSSTHAGGHGM